MKRTLLLLLLFVCAASWACLMSVDFWHRPATPTSGGPAAEITYFDYNQSAFSSVTVYLSVLDIGRQPILGLASNDFSIVEDDVAVAVTDFIGGAGQPVTAVMLIDHSGSMDSGTKMRDAQSAALTFLDHLQDGRDRIGVIAFETDVTVLGSLRLMDGNARADLRERISHLTPNGATSYYDAIYEAVDMLSGIQGRKVVLALTDGQDTASSHGRRSVTRHALDHNVVVYTIGLGYGVARGSLQRIAEETRGQYYEEPSSSELAELYANLAQGLQDEYSLTYTSPTPQLDGTTRRVEVRVQLPSGPVTAEGSYAVGGTLTPSLSLWPCLGALPLLALLALPGLYDLARGRGRLAEPEPEAPASAYEPIPAPSPAPVACPNCGAALRVGAKFCGACGQPAPAAPPAPPSLPAKGAGGVGSAATCARCGVALRPSARYCAKCGQRV